MHLEWTHSTVPHILNSKNSRMKFGVWASVLKKMGDPVLFTANTGTNDKEKDQDLYSRRQLVWENISNQTIL